MKGCTEDMQMYENLVVKATFIRSALFQTETTPVAQRIANTHSFRFHETELVFSPTFSTDNPASGQICRWASQTGPDAPGVVTDHVSVRTFHLDEPPKRSENQKRKPSWGTSAGPNLPKIPKINKSNYSPARRIKLPVATSHRPTTPRQILSS